MIARNPWFKYASHSEIDYYLFGKKKKKTWHFEIFAHTGPYRAGNFKMLLPLKFSSDLTQTLWGRWVPW